MSGIKGYRVLTDNEKLAISDFKGYEIDLLNVLDDLLNDKADYQVDKRWLSIGRTHLEQAFMAIVRSIAKPERFAK